MTKLTAHRRTNTATIFQTTAHTPAEFCAKVNNIKDWAVANGELLWVMAVHENGEVQSFQVGKPQ